MNQEEFEILYPSAREVPLDAGLTGCVFPMGAVHIYRVKDSMESLFKRCATMGVGDVVEEGKTKAQVSQERIALFGAALIPILVTDWFDLLKETTVVGKKNAQDIFEPMLNFRLDLLPHWDLPKLGEVWFDHNFGTEEKRRPWVRVVEKMITRITGESFSLTELWSQTLSQRDTAEAISSKVNSEPEPTPQPEASPSLTAVGPPHSSSGGESKQSDTQSA